VHLVGFTVEIELCSIIQCRYFPQTCLFNWLVKSRSGVTQSSSTPLGSVLALLRVNYVSSVVLNLINPTTVSVFILPSLTGSFN